MQISAVDAVSGQTMYARISYVAEEVRWNARFADMYTRDEHARLMGVDLERFDQVQTLER